MRTGRPVNEQIACAVFCPVCEVEIPGEGAKGDRAMREHVLAVHGRAVPFNVDPARMVAGRKAEGVSDEC